MSYLIDIRTALPPHAIPVESFAAFVSEQSQAKPIDLRKLYWLAKHSGIKTRYAAIPDYINAQAAQLYYREGRPVKADITERMELYAPLSLELSLAAARPLLHGDRQPTHLVYTSCTGLAAPGTDIALVRALGLPAETFRHTVNFMGCYAALHALRTAHYICQAEPGALVLVICTELCSLHYQDSLEEDALLANLLFGDGSAAVLMGGKDHAGTARMEFMDFFASLLPGGEADMSWALRPQAFEMRLSSYVPRLLSAHIEGVVEAAAKRWKVTPTDNWAWALHPGGKSIVDKLGEVLQLSAAQLAPARGVLSRCGNMSSATVLFVLEAILSAPHPANQMVVLGAFGPGLSMELAYGRLGGKE